MLRRSSAQPCTRTWSLRWAPQPLLCALELYSTSRPVWCFVPATMNYEPVTAYLGEGDSDKKTEIQYSEFTRPEFLAKHLGLSVCRNKMQYPHTIFISRCCRVLGDDIKLTLTALTDSIDRPSRTFVPTEEMLQTAHSSHGVLRLSPRIHTGSHCTCRVWLSDPSTPELGDAEVRGRSHLCNSRRSD